VRFVPPVRHEGAREEAVLRAGAQANFHLNRKDATTQKTARKEVTAIGFFLCLKPSAFAPLAIQILR